MPTDGQLRDHSRRLPPTWEKEIRRNKMKKVIDGKVYNTETATLVAEYDNGYYGGDFNKMEEALFKSPKGQFFLAGSGGPMSKYAERQGNTSSSGSGLTLLTEQEALSWCEEVEIDADVIADTFTVEEG